MLILFASSSLSGQQILVRDNSQAHAGGRKDFSLVAENSVADLLIDINDSKTVHLATKLFAADIERVSGQKAKIKCNSRHNR